MTDMKRRDFLAGMAVAPLPFLVQDRAPAATVETREIDVVGPEILVDYGLPRRYDKDGNELYRRTVEAEGLNACLVAMAVRMPGGGLLVTSHVHVPNLMVPCLVDKPYPHNGHIKINDAGEFLYEWRQFHKWKILQMDGYGNVIGEITNESPPNVVRIPKTADDVDSLASRSVMKCFPMSGNRRRNQH